MRFCDLMREGDMSRARHINHIANAALKL